MAFQIRFKLRFTAPRLQTGAHQFVNVSRQNFTRMLATDSLGESDRGFIRVSDDSLRAEFQRWIGIELCEVG